MSPAGPGPLDPNNPLPPQPDPEESEDGTNKLDAAGDVVGGAVDAADVGMFGFVGDAAGFVGDAVVGAAEGVGSLASGAAEVAGSVVEGAGSVLEGAGSLAEGCGGCSLAVLLALFAFAGTAAAVWR